MLRVLVVLASLVVAVASALTLREDRLCERARKGVIASIVNAAPASTRPQALADLKEHCRGTTARLNASAALIAGGDRAQALELAREAAEAEPDNPAAWRAVATVASGAEARAAIERFRRLSPSLNDSAGRSTR